MLFRKFSRRGESCSDDGAIYFSLLLIKSGERRSLFPKKKIIKNLSFLFSNKSACQRHRVVAPETNKLIYFSVAWFTFDTSVFPSETRLSADGLTATTDSYEPRVLLSSVGFSRGVHYWEFTVDRYDGAADPAFGVARRDVARDAMLGKYLSFLSLSDERHHKGGI